MMGPHSQAAPDSLSRTYMKTRGRDTDAETQASSEFLGSINVARGEE